MFQFSAFASWIARITASLPLGCPIRKSAGHRVFAPLRSLSQLITSFFASESQGIPHAPFSHFVMLFRHLSVFEKLLYLVSPSNSQIVELPAAFVTRSACPFREPSLWARFLLSEVAILLLNLSINSFAIYVIFRLAWGLATRAVRKIRFQYVNVLFLAVTRRGFIRLRVLRCFG